MKRIFALVLSLALMVAVFAGCHEKGEIAVTIGEVDFTSGYYACALVFADTEARGIVEDGLSESELAAGDIDYWSKKVEKTDYVKWVEDKAIENLKQIAAIKTLCDENDVELSDETAELAKTQAESAWSSSGTIFEQNGVGKETFMQYIEDTFLADEYFKHLYGKGGKEEIAADEIQKYFTENYVLVNALTASFGSIPESAQKETREKFVAYEKALNDGSKTFEQIYLEYNEVSAEEHKHEEPAEGESAPQDYHATVLGAEDTAYASDQFEDAEKMKVGEVKLITLDESAGLMLLVKKDITADPYYLESMDATLRQEIIGDGYTKLLDKFAKDLKCDINDYSTGQFKVKELKYS